MNAIWNVAEPYILYILSALFGGSIIGGIAYIVCKRLITKASAAYNLNKFADKVADKLGGKTIDIDITAVTEKKIDEIAKPLRNEVDKLKAEINSYKEALGCMCGALSHLKMLSNDERNALITAAQKLNNEYVPPEKEVIATVKLEPITLSESVDADKSDTVNFG